MSRLTFLFAHGAGVPSSSHWMQRWAARLGALGRVETFDYLYAAAGRRSPDPFPKLLARHAQALDELGAAPEDVVLIGKSMGSRVGCHLALERPVRALVCLGYPLRGGGKTPKIRDEVLLKLKTPILFVQGTRDSLCPLDLLEEVRGKMQAHSELFVVESGNHSLEATITHLKRVGRKQDELEAEMLEAIRRFLKI